MRTNALLFLCLLVGTPLIASAQSEPLDGGAIHSSDRQVGPPTGRLLLRLNDTAQRREAGRLFSTLSVTVVDSIRLGPLLIYALDPEPGVSFTTISSSLSASGLFAYVEADCLLSRPREPDVEAVLVSDSLSTTERSLTGTFPPDDPYFPQQWSLHNRGDVQGSQRGADIDIEEAWAITDGDSNIVIGIGEEGYQATHPDLLGSFVSDSVHLALMNNDNPHGTLVAGLIAARRNNGIGIAGIAPGCRIVVTHTQYGTSVLGILKGLEKVVQWNAAILTNSWGYAQRSLQPLQEAYDLIARTGRGGKGTLVIFAAGNERSPWVDYPGWHHRFMSVGGSDREDGRWEGSNFGLELDLCAPSSGIVSTSKGSGYATATGTSLGAPIVAGIAALILSANPSLTADSVRAILEMTCDKVGGYSYEEEREHGAWSPFMGYGRLNAGRALRMAKGISEGGSRLIWPRGGESLYPGRSYTIRWKSDRSTKVFARSRIDGSLQTLGIATTLGNHTARWTPAEADTFDIVLTDGDFTTLLDTTSGPLAVAPCSYTVMIDTTASFVSLDQRPTGGEGGFAGTALTTFAFPFDFMIGSDTLWSWERLAGGASALEGRGFAVSRRSYPSIDPRATAFPGLIGFLSNDLAGNDSIRYGVIGTAPDRLAIIEHIGLRLDTVLNPAAQRQALSGYRRQIQLHERDGSISYHYNMPFVARPDRPERAERGGVTVALRSRDEVIYPFDSVYVSYLPAGSVTFTPATIYRRPQTKPRAAILASGNRKTYGYDLYRLSVLSNRLETLAIRSSSDLGKTWQKAAALATGAQDARILIPTRYNGPFVVALDGIDHGWRDTLTVTDHGYTIEVLPAGSAESIADDRRSALLNIAEGDEGSALPLPFRFPYFGTHYPQLHLFRDGTVEPVDEHGANSLYTAIRAFPRLSPSDPDSLRPIRFLFTYEGSKGVAIIQWDSLSRYSPVGAANASTQLRIYEDGVIDLHLFTPDTGKVPYYSFPSILQNSYQLISPDFTMRISQIEPLQLPLSSFRYRPHTPMSSIPALPAQGKEKWRSQLRVYPNPVRSDLTITRPVDRDGAWSVRVRNLMGETIAVIEGEREIIWNTREVASGIYMIEEEHGHGRTPVVVIR